MSKRALDKATKNYGKRWTAWLSPRLIVLLLGGLVGFYGILEKFDLVMYSGFGIIAVGFGIMLLGEKFHRWFGK
jgi:hypothetical protein